MWRNLPISDARTECSFASNTERMVPRCEGFGHVLQLRARPRSAGRFRPRSMGDNEKGDIEKSSQHITQIIGVMDEIVVDSGSVRSAAGGRSRQGARPHDDAGRGDK